MLQGQSWDAAVLDLQLKKGTGLGVLKALRGTTRPPGARVIVFTNYAFPQYRERSLALGADYFFDKSREFERVRDVASRTWPGEGQDELSRPLRACCARTSLCRKSS